MEAFIIGRLRSDRTIHAFYGTGAWYTAESALAYALLCRRIRWIKSALIFSVDTGPELSVHRCTDWNADPASTRIPINYALKVPEEERLIAEAEVSLEAPHKRANTASEAARRLIPLCVRINPKE